jgi:hypothetical protein
MPFTEMLKKSAMETASGPTLASTMSLGQGTGVELSDLFRTSTKKIFLALDAGVLFATGQGDFLAKYFGNHPQMHIIPITSGTDFKSIHHWKFIVNQYSDASALSSMNFTTPLKTPFLEFIYSFSSPEITDELKANLYTALRRQCAAFDDFKCYVDFSHREVVSRLTLYGMYLRACEQLKIHLGKELEKEPRNVYFMQPQDSDLAYLAKQMVRGAKKEVVLLTHKFSLEDLMLELLHAAKRGIRVYVLATKPAELPKRMIPKFYYHSDRKFDSRRMPDPHMKTMIVDRSRMLFGTGNFTRNAFNGARELFAVTENKKAIDQVLQVAASLYHRYEPEKYETFGGDLVEQPWVVLQSTAENTNTENNNPNLHEIPFTIESGEPWLQHYRKVTKEGISRLGQCKMGHLLLLPEMDFRDCLARTKDTATQ